VDYPDPVPELRLLAGFLALLLALVLMWGVMWPLLGR
jgi:hypothetical protein